MQDLTYNPLRDAANRQAEQAAAAPSYPRRTIGPIPPRDKFGRLCLVEQVDDNGAVIPRDSREYACFEMNMKPAPESIKGLKLFEVDLVPEPLALVYARNADHAVEVYRAEFGVTKFGEFAPTVTQR